MTDDERFAYALAIARACKVIVVQRKSGGITTHAKRPPGHPRGPEVGGTELRGRIAYLNRRTKQ